MLTASYRGGVLHGPCTLRMANGGTLRGEYRFGVPDGVWSIETGGKKREWQLKDGVPEELYQIIKGI